MKSISLVVAMDRNRLIGRAGGLPWRLPEDLKWFKRHTVGKTVLMGRKTWDSLGKALPDRANWVVSRDPAFRPAGARVFRSIDDALAAHADGELMVIGGAALFERTLPLAQRLYLTEVDAALEGDTWFPPYDAAAFHEVARETRPADERHAHPYAFVTLERKRV